MLALTGICLSSKLKQVKELVEHIQNARNIILSTHRQCDGDGLGAELALYFALKKMKKNVQVLNVDATPKKYGFLKPDSYIRYFDQNQEIPKNPELFLIFDTNDERLVEP